MVEQVITIVEVCDNEKISKIATFVRCTILKFCVYSRVFSEDTITEY